MCVGGGYLVVLPCIIGVGVTKMIWILLILLIFVLKFCSWFLVIYIFKAFVDGPSNLLLRFIYIFRSLNLLPRELLLVSSNIIKQILVVNLFLSVIVWIIIIMNPFFTFFELENSIINKTDNDDTLLTFIHGNIHTWKGCHIFEGKYVSHQVSIQMNLHDQNLKGYNRIILLHSSISNNSKFLIFSTCMYIFYHLQVFCYNMSWTSINHNPSQSDCIPVIMMCQNHTHVEESK